MEYLTLRKPPKDVIDDVKGYTIKVTDDDTKIKDSLFLIGVVLSPKSETALIGVRKSIMGLQSSIYVLEDTLLSIDVVMPSSMSPNKFNISKKYGEIIGTTDHYSIDAKKSDTGGKSSVMLMDVAVDTASENEIDNIRNQVESLQSQIETLENNLIEIEVILPVVLLKNDFSKGEINNG